MRRELDHMVATGHRPWEMIDRRIEVHDHHSAGREAAIVWLAGLFATLNVHRGPDELIDAGDSVVVVFRQIARGRASGAELTSRFVFVYGFRKGKISYVGGYRTKAEALDAVALRE